MTDALYYDTGLSRYMNTGSFLIGSNDLDLGSNFENPTYRPSFVFESLIPSENNDDLNETRDNGYLLQDENINLMTHIDNIIVDNYYYIMKAISENINEYNPGQTIDDLECNCDGKIPADNPERANFFRYNMICRKDFCNNCVIKDDIRDENPFDRCGICNGKGCARNGWDPVNETCIDGKKYKNDEKTHKKTTALYCEDNGFWWDHNNERCLYNKIYKDDEEGGETAQQKCENDIHKWDPLNGSCSDLMSQNQAECESKKAELDPVNETCTNGNTYNTTQTAREKCETNNGGQFYSSNKTCEILHLSYNDDDELISPEQQCKNSPRKWFEGTCSDGHTYGNDKDIKVRAAQTAQEQCELQTHTWDGTCSNGILYQDIPAQTAREQCESHYTQPFWTNTGTCSNRISYQDKLAQTAQQQCEKAGGQMTFQCSDGQSRTQAQCELQLHT